MGSYNVDALNGIIHELGMPAMRMKVFDKIVQVSKYPRRVLNG